MGRLGQPSKLIGISIDLRYESTFGLWSVHFPPVLVRTARRLLVEALGERGVLVAGTGYPRDGAPGPVLYQGYQKSKRNLVYGIWSQ